MAELKIELIFDFNKEIHPSFFKPKLLPHLSFFDADLDESSLEADVFSASTPQTTDPSELPW